MKTQASNANDLHQKVALLLPWYINQTLQGSELQQVERHVSDCLLCRREVAGLRKVADAFKRDSDLELAAEASLAGLRAKLPVRARVDRSVVPIGQKPKLSRLTGLLRSNQVRFALAASLLIAAFPWVPSLWNGTSTSEYITLSAAKPEVSVTEKDLRVVFAASVPETEIHRLISELHAERVGQPNSVGAITLRLDRIHDGQDLQHALALLRSHPEVEFAEPVMQP